MSEKAKPPAESAPAASVGGPEPASAEASASTPAAADETAVAEAPPSAQASAGGPARKPAESGGSVPSSGQPAAPITAEPRPRAVKGPRPTLAESREPLYREAGGFRLRLEPADLARLRELPGSKGRTDRELGEEFFEKQADRFAQSLAEDVTPPAEVRVVVDPYSRQAFLAIERTIRSILSF